MKRILSLIIILSLQLSLTGCWSRYETEDLAIISAIGIDKVPVDGKDLFRLVVQIIRPGSMVKGETGGRGGKKEVSWLVSSLCDNPADALINISTRSPRKMFLAQNKVIVISERLARGGLRQISDWLQRNQDIRIRSWILVARGDSLEALAGESELETLYFEELAGLLEDTRSQVSKAEAMDLKDFFMALASPGKDPVVSKLEIINVREPLLSGESSQDQGKALRAIRLTGAAVFREDKLAGWLGDDETKGYLYLSGKARQGIIPFSIPSHRKDKKELGKEAAYYMTRSKSKIKPVIEGRKLKIEIAIKAEGDLGEHEGELPVARAQDLKEINAVIADKITEMTSKTMNKLQKEYKADSLGLGDIIHRQYPKIWAEIKDDWREIYPQVEVEIKVQAHVRRTGLISESMKIR